MDRHFTIGELARAASVPTSTVRYYERAGLLEPAGRTGGNYRFYGEAALERLQFIRAAQATGFSLDDIASLLPLRSAAPSSCRQVQTLIRERLVEVRERMNDLRRVERVLKAALGECEHAEGSGHCETLDKLHQCSCCPPELAPPADAGKRRQKCS